ncbi:ARP2/3 complex ARPC3 subunit [Lasiosphaeria hispida]|uniref:Actin-related protein 2/3 complex subunit 3 n=1 Tax=Lasiosphaeria hispida TaxID=260671 RepID=A0AAJ0HDI5_9PEZI|nr:ARP2/3 complex ARPC3 subunit [Lasiosphaeria hispida]
MPAYNSIFNEDPNPPRLVGNFPLLPLRTKIRGPVYPLPFPDPPLPASESPDPDSGSYDILDEVLALFRANTFFRNFEIQGPADRLLVYGIWFVSDCLSKIKQNANVRDATKDVTNLALDTHFAIPGDPAWPLNQMYEPPRDRQDGEILRQYMSQVRQELASRLLARVFDEGGDGKPSKWWLSFTKRKFMGKGL